jgi:hypothetical protein
MSPRGATRMGELLLFVVAAVVLPMWVADDGEYLVLALPVLVAGAVLGYVDGRSGRR